MRKRSIVSAVVGVVASSAALVLPATAQAQSALTGIGLPPEQMAVGPQFDTLCAPGQALVGIRARTGTSGDLTVISDIAARCQVPGSGVVTDALPARALVQQTDPVVDCAAGLVATGVHGRGGVLVDSLGLRCQDLARTIAAVDSQTLGGAGGHAQAADCPDGEVAVGLRYVSGLLESDLALQAARIDLLCDVVPDAESCGTAEGLAGCWHFDEADGLVATDASGHGNDGAYLAGATLGVPGQLGTAVSLDGVNDLVRVPDAPTLDVGSSFTFEGWVRRSSATKSHQLVLKGDKGLHVAIMSATAGSQVLLRKANVTTLARSEDGVPADGAFHHVLVTMDGPGTPRILVDGVDSTVQVVTNQAIQDTALPLFFGSAATTEATFDEFALYDEPLDTGPIG